MRVVADTNVYLSAMNFGGVPDEVLALARGERIQLFVSGSILLEIERVLLEKFGWATGDASDALDLIRDFTVLVDPQERLDAVSADESDNRILECAVEARADIVVSGDSHLKELGSFRGIAILSPRQFLELLESGGGHVAD